MEFVDFLTGSEYESYFGTDEKLNSIGMKLFVIIAAFYSLSTSINFVSGRVFHCKPFPVTQICH